MGKSKKKELTMRTIIKVSDERESKSKKRKTDRRGKKEGEKKTEKKTYRRIVSK